MTNKKLTFMAFSAGQQSKEAGVVQRYIGVGSVHVVGINPTKDQLNELFNINLDEEPSYTGTAEQDGKQIPYARVEVVLRTDPEANSGIENTSRMSLFVRKAYRMNRDNTKVQVIDKYGRTAWVTKEELQKHEIPTYSNGNKAQLDADYRPVYQGEEDLVNFLKAFLNIPNPMVYKNKQWVPAENLDECCARLDNMDKLFEGKFNEVIDAWKLQPNNKVKVLFGVRTNPEGKQYQTHYTRMFLRNGAANYDRLEADVKATQEAGALSTSEFLVAPLQEYKVDATPLNESAAAGSDPFGDPKDNPFFQ